MPKSASKLINQKSVCGRLALQDSLLYSCQKRQPKSVKLLHVRRFQCKSTKKQTSNKHVFSARS